MDDELGGVAFVLGNLILGHAQHRSFFPPDIFQ